MPYCSKCGTQVSEEMSFCPNCGASLTSEVRTYALTDTVASNTGDYKIYITSIGTASEADVADLLEDTLGYTALSANNLLMNIPVQIAGNLSLKQAAVIAQAFEEYGVELSVTNGDEAEDISAETSSSSIFNSDGSFLTSAALVLAGLTAANRLRAINKPKQPSLLTRIFRSLFANKRKPPVHVRRTIGPRNTVFNQPRKRVVRQQIRPISPASPYGKPERRNAAGPGDHKPGSSAHGPSRGRR